MLTINDGECLITPLTNHLHGSDVQFTYPMTKVTCARISFATTLTYPSTGPIISPHCQRVFKPASDFLATPTPSLVVTPMSQSAAMFAHGVSKCENVVVARGLPYLVVPVDSLRTTRLSIGRSPLGISGISSTPVTDSEVNTSDEHPQFLRLRALIPDQPNLGPALPCPRPIPLCSPSLPLPPSLQSQLLSTTRPLPFPISYSAMSPYRRQPLNSPPAPPFAIN